MSLSDLFWSVVSFMVFIGVFLALLALDIALFALGIFIIGFIVYFFLALVGLVPPIDLIPFIPLI